MLRVATQMALFGLICCVIVGPIQPVFGNFADSFIVDMESGWRIPSGGDDEVALAMNIFRQAVYFRPDNVSYHLNLAFLYANFPEVAMRASALSREELFQELLNISKRARTLDPDNLEVAIAYASNFSYADQFGVTPRWDEVEEAWMYCLYITEEVEDEGNLRRDGTFVRLPLLLHLAHEAIEEGHYEKASALLKNAIRIMPESARARALYSDLSEIAEKTIS